MKIYSEPWEIHKDAIGIKDKNTKYIRVRGTQLGGKFHIADVRFFVCDDDGINKRNELEAYGIAKIISAAPDLLEALEDVFNANIDWVSRRDLISTFDKVDAAIKKARGHDLPRST